MIEAKVADVVPYLSRKSIAAMLDIHKDAVRNLERSGRIPPPSLYVGRCPRWSFEVIDRLAKGGVI